MEIQDFKRWHWIVISLVIGAALAYARSMIAPDEQPSGRGVTPVEFVQKLTQKTDKGYPLVQDVVIYPAQTAPDSSGQSREVNFVVCSFLKPTKPGKGFYDPMHFTAEVPFKVGNMVEPKSEKYSVRDYMAEMQQQFPEVKVRYAWWAQKPAQFGIWMGGTLVLIGGIWPMLISLMVGAGLGKPKKEQDDYDLDRFGKTPEPAKAQQAKPAIPVGEMDRLREMQEQMEKNLAGAGMQITGSGEATSAAGSTPGAPGIRKLTGAAVEVPLTPAQDDESKEYGGEYYPVAKLHVPHHDGPQEASQENKR
jgi:hypothetical protein